MVMHTAGGNPMNINILLFQERGIWVAQCLEFDVAAQASTLNDVIYEFQRVLCGHIAMRKELDLPPLESDLPPAPEVYWRQYERAARLEKTAPRIQIPSMSVDVQHPEYRIAA
jgi:hypothetical protein